jgi:formyl-CoA transferase
MQPLTDVLVVSIEQAVAAPLATRHLADLGARVIKIERPDGGDFARGYDTTVLGQSSYFVWLNRGKESIAIDLRSPHGHDVLNRLLARADVFVQNLAPGAVARLGAAPEDLTTRWPRLITCSISGYGDGGPLASRKAYDLLVQAESGAMAITGTPDEACRVGISVADIAAGMYAYSGILSALIARASTGRGAVLSVSLFDALTEWLGAPLYYAMYGGAAPPRTGAHHATVAPYGAFRCADGRAVFLAIQNPREWTRFCAEVLGDPSLATDARFEEQSARVANRHALHDVIGRLFNTLDADAVVARLDSADIAWARLNDLADVADHPQIVERGRWREVGTPAGRVRALEPPVRVAGAIAPMRDVPALGQHTRAILQELGIADERT